MLNCIKDFNTERNKDQPSITTENDLKATIQQYTKKFLGIIDSYQKSSVQAREDLSKFETVCKNHKQSLEDSQKSISTLLVGNNGEIAKLSAEIKKDQDTLAEEQEEYHHGRRADDALVVTKTTEIFL